MKNDDSIVKPIPWITPFIDVLIMNIHQKMVIFFEKKIKEYFKAVISSLKPYENTLKFNFLMFPLYWLFTQIFLNRNLMI